MQRPVAESEENAIVRPPPSTKKVNDQVDFAGRIRFFYNEWRKLGANENILNIISEYKIPFRKIPLTKRSIFTKNFSLFKRLHLSEEINILLTLLVNAIRLCTSVANQFLSPCFLVKRKNGKYRFILNLKTLNLFVQKNHFKMEDYRTVFKLISPNCFMASIDLKDGYFHVSIYPSHRKFLRFSMDNNLSEFCCLPFGLCSGPYIFLI